jgi:hypothetical protein
MVLFICAGWSRTMHILATIFVSYRETMRIVLALFPSSLLFSLLFSSFSSFSSSLFYISGEYEGGVFSFLV